ncbi:glycosyltransferase [Planctomonas psychrotolerans]|uniref:glycosyltransferase n=1 Tax=Planctomonas psychrotolerans TaxID=2528712 RepID=UPI001239AD1B|nr:glycosyltransferase [Planctomonas psychrotolerans]
MPKHLLVCAAGGHLKQLFALADRIGIAPEDQQWVTYDSALSRSILEGRDTVFAPYTAPRGAIGTTRSILLARSMLKEREYVSAISTGAILGVAFLPLAARRGVSAHYIESAARADSPSMSGRILARDRKVHTYTQYPAWADERWQYRGSIFDSYAPGPAMPGREVKKVVVTVGTTESYGFRRLFDKLVPMLSGLDVLWQVGKTDVSDLGIDGRERLPHDDLKAAVRDADLVITHSGTGSALTAMDYGKHPVLVPRLKQFNEHVDSHQVEIAKELSRRGLATLCHVEDLDWTVFDAAVKQSVRDEPNAPRIVLDGLRLD